jgi:putative intracellular protease/amidase
MKVEVPDKPEGISGFLEENEIVFNELVGSMVVDRGYWVVTRKGRIKAIVASDADAIIFALGLVVIAQLSREEQPECTS